MTESQEGGKCREIGRKVRSRELGRRERKGERGSTVSRKRRKSSEKAIKGRDRELGGREI